jgi:hypothetical protein
VCLNNTIVKASIEGVEIYNLKNKQWTIAQIKINYKGEFTFYRGSGYSAITDNILMVYGGYNEDENGTDECYYWKVN